MPTSSTGQVNMESEYKTATVRATINPSRQNWHDILPVVSMKLNPITVILYLISTTIGDNSVIIIFGELHFAPRYGEVQIQEFGASQTPRPKHVSGSDAGTS